MKRHLLLLFCSVFLAATIIAQDFSNKGKEFWIAYSYHVGMAQGGLPVMTLYITSDVNTAYTAEVFGGATIQSGNITAGQVVTVVVPTTCILDNEGLFSNRAIRVTTDKNAVVYAYITRSAVSGATVCLPTPVLGKEYYSVNFTQISNEPNSNSFFTIIAVEDNTVVEITPSANTKNGWVAGTTYTVSLNKGQIYQVLGTTTGNTGTDLTGSLIRSVSSAAGGCKRIAVFAGSGKIAIGCGGSGTSDNLYQQLYPTGSWGMKYLTVPSYNRPVNFYRIIRKNSSTNVYVNGSLIPSASFINGVYYEFSNNSANEIVATEPVSVAQYFTTQGCSGNGTPYDPDMIILNPVEQNINNVTLVSSNLVAPQNQQHHLHVIMRNTGTGISSFRLDGTPVPASSWTVHPADATYSYLYLPNVTQGYHTLRSDSGFNALAYGYANAESYGYSAGANVKDLYQFVSILNQYATVNYPATCRNTPFYFRIVLPYQPTQLQWVFGAALNALGIADVTQTGPAFDSTWIVNGRQVYRYSLPSSYAITAIGTYPIKIIANNPTSDGCSGVQEIDYDLQVFESPVASFSFTGAGCNTGPVSFQDNSNTSGQPVIRWIWDLGDGNSASVQHPQHTYAQPGTYPASLAVITDIGCISPPAVNTVIIHPQPVTGFMVAAMPFCEQKDIIFTDTSSVSSGSIVKWNWNLGDGSTPMLTNASPFSHNYTTAGSYTISLRVETDKGCVGPVLTRSLVVNEKPQAGFISPEICLTDPFAPFIDTSRIATGSISSWQWNFGDPAAGPGNPNTSTLQHPTHRYITTGNYTATLVVTSSQGCADTLAQTFTVNGSVPVADFAVQHPTTLCSNRQVNISNTSSVDFGNIVKIEIYWDWPNDPSLVTVDNQPSPGKLYSHSYAEFFNPVSATYTVRMMVYSGQNCLDEVSKNITILATPAVRFDPLPAICTNAPALQLTQAGISNALPGTGTFSGPGISASGLFNPAIAGAGTHTIRFTYTGTNTCSNFMQQTILVNPAPTANAGSDKTVLEGGAVQLTPTLVTSIPVSYSWTPSTGLSNASIPDPMASPLDDITYTLTVTSDRGCSNADKVFVKVLKTPEIPNVFTPNKDGINDTWVIRFLETYPGCTVEVYNRYGQIIFRSVGYNKPWDGTFNGKDAPAGTYYYIVDPKNGRKRMAGFVDLVR